MNPDHGVTRKGGVLLIRIPITVVFWRYMDRDTASTQTRAPYPKFGEKKALVQMPGKMVIIVANGLSIILATQ
jgi:hypothetical protein